MSVRLIAANSVPAVAARAARAVEISARTEKWQRRSETWGCLMAAAQDGDSRAYAQLMRELDDWLKRYYARRLPHPASEDARQEALLAIHAKRHAYHPARSFGPWVAAIARYKWVDGLRDAARYVTMSRDRVVPIEAGWDGVTSAIAIDELLRRLTPAQARAIRLVKLEGASIEGAASTSGQSASLVKVNIHRGLKRLASLVVDQDVSAAAFANSSLASRPSSVANRANDATRRKSVRAQSRMVESALG